MNCFYVFVKNENVKVNCFYVFVKNENTICASLLMEFGHEYVYVIHRPWSVRIGKKQCPRSRVQPKAAGRGP